MLRDMNDRKMCGYGFQFSSRLPILKNDRNNSLCVQECVSGGAFLLEWDFSTSIIKSLLFASKRRIS